MTSQCTIFLTRGKASKIKFTIKDESDDNTFEIPEGVSVEIVILPQKKSKFLPARTFLSTLTHGVEVTDAVNGVVKVTIPSVLVSHATVLNYTLAVVGAGGSPRVSAAQGLIQVVEETY